MSSLNEVKAKDESNTELATAAQKALFDPAFVTGSGMCQKFVRQVIQKVYGSKYDKYHQATAELSRQKWHWSDFQVDPARGSVVGDILYKRGTDRQSAGHVGIRIAGNRVAENSSVHRNGVNGSKGVRTLEAFGKVDLIVRLPMKK